MALRDKPNEDLFRLYDDELVLHLNNRKNLRTARKLLDDFRHYLGEARPSPEGAKGFLTRFTHLSTGTRAWYTLTVKGFMKWYGLPLEDLKVKVSRDIPPYIETDDVHKLLQAAGDKRTHKKIAERDQLLVETLWRTGLRRAEAAKLCPRDIKDGKVLVRKGKGEKDRVVPLLSSLEKKLANFTRGMPPDQPIFGLTAESIGMKITNIARRAGLTGMHTHALRHKGMRRQLPDSRAAAGRHPHERIYQRYYLHWLRRLRGSLSAAEFTHRGCERLLGKESCENNHLIS